MLVQWKVQKGSNLPKNQTNTPHMKVYSINYTLKAPGRNYAPLLNAIRSLFPDHIHPLDSCWFVYTSVTAMQIKDLLTPHMDVNDVILVLVAKGPGAAQLLDSTSVNWLNSKLPID
ncbi:hypothetical protein GCM10023213_19950 [Prosthecobacter algae]|uniref:Uncharacterized protein n=1 Tax=Prosthecobacter algae TaxID=1144682 RepID=A0ABP9P214_9BACT